MSDFDEELEDDLEDSAGPDEIADDFEDPQQTTAALTKEINKLRQKNEVLRQFNVRQKEKYKEEVRTFLTPLIQKYKDIQSESEFLKRQIKEISQNTALSTLKSAGENGGNGHSQHDDLVKLMESNLEEKEREVAVLNKMVKTLEDENFSLKKDAAEMPELKETLRNKNEKIAQLEDEKFELASKSEAKDNLVNKYLKQISELETNVYVLNKRISERVGSVVENSKVSDYEDKLSQANQQIERLNNRIENLEKQLSDYQDTMSTLEQELDEDAFMQKAEHDAEESQAISLTKDTTHEENEPAPVEAYDYTKHYDHETNESDDEFADLPSDDDLLANDIDLEEMTEDENFDTLPEDIVDNLLSEDSDPELEISDLPVENYDDELESSDLEGLLDDSDLNLDDLPVDEDTESINFEKGEEDKAYNPLDEFDTSDDMFDEDRDVASKKG